MQDKIQIQFVKIPVSEALTFYINEKLGRTLEKYPWVIKAQVFIKKEVKDVNNECVCEIELSLPGPRKFASFKSYNYEVAIKNTLAELEHQLKKVKERSFSTN